MDKGVQVVTGGLGYSGRYMVARLLKEGHRVRTITGSGHRPNPFGSDLDIRPLDFERPGSLTESLKGATTLYNTYWVRFNHRKFSHRKAVDNTLVLFEAAVRAGVRRVVHVSITNPDEDSPLEYFRGKAVLEKELRSSGLSHAILRPTVLFGKEDILINNIAWALRNLPVFGVPGDGSYRLQPIYVDDLAELAVEQGKGSGNVTVHAIGPETFTFKELVEETGDAIGCRKKVIPMPDFLVYLSGRMLGALLGDVVVTREEIAGLKAGLLHVDDNPAGRTRLSAWMRAHADRLGVSYASELGRRQGATQ